jgi:hypothetical protein
MAFIAWRLDRPSEIAGPHVESVVYNFTDRILDYQFNEQQVLR